MALLKQMKLSLARQRQRMVGDRIQLAAFWLAERARALDAIDP
jgi:hypothetical protein